MKDLSKVTHLVFEGGGIAGIAEAGAYGAARRHLTSVNTYGGTSAGAILAMLCAAGAAPSDLRRTMESTPWRRFMPSKPGRIADLFTFLQRGAYSDLDFAERWIRRQLMQLRAPGDKRRASRYPRGFEPDVTFAEMVAQTGRRLCVVATNEKTLRPVLFSSATTPRVKVARAVLASMAIPGVWPSVLIDDVPYCDGGIFENLPLRIVAGDLPAESVLGIAIDTPGEHDVEPYATAGLPRFRRIVRAVIDAGRNHQPSHLYPSRVCVIPRPSWLKATAFDLSKEKMNAAWEIGRTAMEKWQGREEGLIDAVKRARGGEPPVPFRGYA